MNVLRLSHCMGFIMSVLRLLQLYRGYNECTKAITAVLRL